MKREQIAFLFGGFAFGILVGFGLFHAIEHRPLEESGTVADAGIPGPRGPMAPTQAGEGDAPVVPLINELKRQLAEDPRNTELLLRLGDLYEKAAMTEQAVTFYERAAEVRPDDLELLTHIANLHHDGERWQAAVDFYERVLVLRPQDPDLWTDLGVCYRGLGRFDRALEVFERAHAIDATHWQSLFNKVVVAAFDLGRFDVALDAMRSIEAIDPRPADLPEARIHELRQALEAAAARSGGRS